MKFNNPFASVLIPDGKTIEEAFERITHLGIGAHQDDLEVMAFHGIKVCYRDPGKWFGGIICTDGGGSVRSGKYANHSDEEMARVRKREQEKAAVLGEYSFIIQLDYPSSALKKPGENKLEEELSRLLSTAKPPVVYTHNPADKHETHTGTAITVIKAIGKLPLKDRPKVVYGCEAWRDLDWMCDEDKIILEVSDEENLGKELVEIFDSQISGGKKYDLATIGRRRANATFFQSHEADKSSQVLFAMDLSPLIGEDPPGIADYVLRHIKRFQTDVETKIKSHPGR